MNISAGALGRGIAIGANPVSGIVMNEFHINNPSL
jgi:hypothetical protein